MTWKLTKEGRLINVYRITGDSKLLKSLFDSELSNKEIRKECSEKGLRVEELA